MKYLALIALAMPLSGCDGIDSAVNGTPSFREVQEQRQALAMPVVETPAPAVAVVPAAIVQPPAPECREVFRVTACVDGVATDWVW